MQNSYFNNKNILFSMSENDYFKKGEYYNLNFNHIKQSISILNSTIIQGEYVKDLDNIVDGYGYWISTRGRIFNIFTNRWSFGHLSDRGYLKTRVRIGFREKTFTIHRLVALAFIYNPDPITRPIIDHKDRNKQNNDVTNLRWVSYIENVVPERGKHGGTKPIYDEPDLHFICKCLENGMSPKEIHTRYGYLIEIINKILYKEDHTRISRYYNLPTSFRSKCNYSDEEVRSFCIMNRDFNLNSTQIGKIYNYPRDSIYRILNGRNRIDITSEYFNFKDPLDKKYYDIHPHTLWNDDNQENGIHVE